MDRLQGGIRVTARETKPISDQPVDEAAELLLDAEANADIDAGRGVPHAKVREWLLKLAKGERVPPPTA
jgi:predicted transcriptional regulator